MARREFARIGTDMPDEPTIRALTHDEQWLYDHALYLRRELSRCGVVPLRPAVWAELATDVTEAKCRRWLKGLEKRRLVIVDEKYSEVLIRTFVRHDRILNQPNVVANMVADFHVIHSPKIRTAFLTELRRLWDLPQLSDGERGGWCLAMGHYPAHKTERSQVWPAYLEGATLDRLKKSIGSGLIDAMTEHITEGSGEPFTEASPGGIPKPFIRTPYAGAIAESPLPRATSPEPHAPSSGGIAPANLEPHDDDPHVQQLLEQHQAATGALANGSRQKLAGHIRDGLTRTSPDVIADALQTYRDRASTGAKVLPGLLPGLIDDAMTARATSTRNSTSSRAAQTLALADRLDAAQGPHR